MRASEWTCPDVEAVSGHAGTQLSTPLPTSRPQGHSGRTDTSGTLGRVRASAHPEARVTDCQQHPGAPGMAVPAGVGGLPLEAQRTGLETQPGVTSKQAAAQPQQGAQTWGPRNVTGRQWPCVRDMHSGESGLGDACCLAANLKRGGGGYVSWWSEALGPRGAGQG